MKHILYIEDVNFVYAKTKEILRKPLVENRIEIVHANCIEKAYFYIKKGNIDGIIIDLQIGHCDLDELMKIQESKIDLQKFYPYNGIGLLIHLQQYIEYLGKTPKLILTATELEVIYEYYTMLLGPKDYAKKSDRNDFLQQNCNNILQWLNNKILCNA